MKLHYYKLLLFSLPLNILVSSYAHNKNKSYITIYTPTTTSRVLIECNLYMPNYDYYPDMNSVRENFDRQTSERFHEYDKRMIKNRRKFKEKCDNDMQQIIVKDKIQKSLEEKVEKGCLKCGCGLGGVAVGVGLLGTAVVNELKRAALAASIETAIASCEAKGAVAGHAAGVAKFIDGLKALGIDKLGIERLESFYTTTPFTEVSNLPIVIHQQYQVNCSSTLSNTKSFCSDIYNKLNLLPQPSGIYVKPESIIAGKLNEVVTHATEVAESAAETATGNVTAGAIKTNIAVVDTKYASCQIAINASVVAILVIVLVMVIIYLILRYRRKRKVNKKLQYTKLLNQ
ncbi:rifin [Plasmodium sp. gorilla clade G1]|nr:rifin [Plasmodium sp. gorilla clade G1]